MKALIVDNTYDVARRTERVLLNGYNCATTHSPSREQTLQLLKENNYDLIFLDLCLDGFELIDANVILQTIFTAPYRHGAVFIISNLASSADSDSKVKNILDKYQVLGIAPPMLDDNAREPPEYKLIKRVILSINSIAESKAQPTSSFPNKIKNFLMVMLSWITGMFVLNLILPQGTPSFDALSPEIKFGLISIPGILTAIGTYWNQIILLLSKLIK